MKMMNQQMKRTRLQTLLVVAMSMMSLTAWANVGQALYTFGNVTVERPTISVLGRGDAVNAGDVIVTGAKGYAQIKLADGTKVAIRPGSRFVIEELEAPATATEPAIGSGTALKAKFALQKGGFRTITGRIAKRDPTSYQVSTPSAVIRVRGTNYVARLCVADCGGTDDGLYVGVSDGGVALSNGGGELNLAKNQYGFAADFNTPPSRLLAPPASLQDDGLAVLEEEEEEEDSEESSEESEGEESEEEGDAEEADSGEDGDAEDGDSSEDSGDSSDESGDSSDSDGSGDSSGDEGSISVSREGDVTSGAASTATSTGGTSTATVTSPTADAAPVQEIIAVGPGGTEVDLTGGVGEFVNRGLAFSTKDFAVSTNTNATTATFDDAGNLTGFDESSDTTKVSYGIGSAANLNTGFDTTSQLRWGRWAEGVAQTTTDGLAFSDLDLTNSSLHWVVALTDEVLPTQAITGTASYSLVGNTDPTDSAGNIGFLGRADLSADFTNATVQSRVELGINNQAWSAVGTGSINVNLFSGLYNTVKVNGEAVGTGSFSGNFVGFSGAVPQGAGLSYLLQNGATAVNGVAVFGNPVTP
jgi:hypothetical protein